ncbi:MAG: cyclic nucleotide-binding/CBS domain-containing protein [Candidatus Hodarchaeota archaeon]
MGESRGIKVRDVMHENLISVESNALMVEAISAMIDHKIGSVVVTRYCVPVGIVTERDCVWKVCGNQLDSNAVSVEEIMTIPLITIESHANISKAAQLMLNHKVHHLLVTRGRSVIGIISDTDLLTMIN